MKTFREVLIVNSLKCVILCFEPIKEHNASDTKNVCGCVHVRDSHLMCS